MLARIIIIHMRTPIHTIPLLAVPLPSRTHPHNLLANIHYLPRNTTITLMMHLHIHDHIHTLTIHKNDTRLLLLELRLLELVRLLPSILVVVVEVESMACRLSMDLSSDCHL
jgi:hypothetical protein